MSTRVDEAALDLDTGGGEAQVVGDGQRRHLEPDAPPACARRVLVRRRRGRHEQDALEAERGQRLGGDDEVAEVRRVEAAAEHAEARRGVAIAASPRTCPSPQSSYLTHVSSCRAMGPRTCSFWVEMPISAPRPNWPPSVKRVDALT